MFKNLKLLKTQRAITTGGCDVCSSRSNFRRQTSHLAFVESTAPWEAGEHQLDATLLSGNGLRWRG